MGVGKQPRGDSGAVFLCFCNVPLLLFHRNHLTLAVKEEGDVTALRHEKDLIFIANHIFHQP